jgi:uncharacterized protein (DUF3084 family)
MNNLRFAIGVLLFMFLSANSSANLFVSSVILEAFKKALNTTELEKAKSSIAMAKVEPDRAKRLDLLKDAENFIDAYKERENALQKKELELITEASQAERKKLDLLTQSQDLATKAVALQQKSDQLEAEGKILLASKNDLESQKRILISEKTVLTDQKTALLKDKHELENREKYLATGLIASLASLLIAITSGAFKWPLVKFEKRIAQLKIEDLQLTISEKKANALSFSRSETIPQKEI